MTLPFPPRRRPPTDDDFRPFPLVRPEPADATRVRSALEALLRAQTQAGNQGTMQAPSGLEPEPLWARVSRLGSEMVLPFSVPEMWDAGKKVVRGDVVGGAKQAGTEALLALATGGIGHKLKAGKEAAEMTARAIERAAVEGGEDAARAVEARAQRAITTGKGKPRGQEPFGVLTAENAGGQPGKPAANRAAMQALDKSLERRGLADRAVPVTGAYTDETTGKTLSETGRMILGATPYDMETLGRQFGQNSVLSDKGLHDLASGSVIPSRGTLRAETLPAGAPYTQLPTGERISLDLNWNQKKPLADVAPKLGKYAPGAPSILLPPNSGTVLNEANLGRMVPELARMERAPTSYPVNPDWGLIDPITAKFRTEYTPAVMRGIKADPRSLGWYDTSELAKLFQDHAPNGLEDFQLAMRLTSPPSAGTKVFPDNLRMGAWAYEQVKKGKMTPEALLGRLEIPEGYRHRYQSSVNRNWRRILEEGNLDPYVNPKTYRHGEIPALGQWWNAALDRHVGRSVGVPGLLKNPNTKLYEIPGVGYPEPSYATTRRIDTSPTDTHYSMIEDGLLDEAARLGLAPPQYMAAGWVGNAPKTGVDDTRPLLSLYNEMFRTTGQKHGITPLEAAKQWAAGGLPLWALLGMAGSAAGERQLQQPQGTKEDDQP